ncbi:transposase, partial [Rhodococcus zopfii]|uniref:transposase n=1 Tax=Rhodococcus zopfii TaxID=43772 RepID=UPI003655D59F
GRSADRRQGDQLSAHRDTTCPPTGTPSCPLTADRGYDYDKYRNLLRGKGITPMIARRGAAHGSGLGKVRWVVERTFAWLHQFKRLRTRSEVHADLHQGLLELACNIICLRRLRSSF